MKKMKNNIKFKRMIVILILIRKNMRFICLNLSSINEMKSNGFFITLNLFRLFKI